MRAGDGPLSPAASAMARLSACSSATGHSGPAPGPRCPAPAAPWRCPAGRPAPGTGAGRPRAGDRGGVVALQEGQPAAAEQRLGPQHGRRVGADGDRRVHPVPDLVVLAAQVGVALQRPGDAQRRHRSPPSRANSSAARMLGSPPPAGPARVPGRRAPASPPPIRGSIAPRPVGEVTQVGLPDRSASPASASRSRA